MQQSTFTGARNPFRAPRRNLVAIAIQYFTLSPNNVLKTMLKCGFIGSELAFIH
jgi:hypothetical protein